MPDCIQPLVRANSKGQLMSRLCNIGLSSSRRRVRVVLQCQPYTHTQLNITVLFSNWVIRESWTRAESPHALKRRPVTKTKKIKYD